MFTDGTGVPQFSMQALFYLPIYRAAAYNTFCTLVPQYDWAANFNPYFKIS